MAGALGYKLSLSESVARAAARFAGCGGRQCRRQPRIAPTYAHVISNNDIVRSDYLFQAWKRGPKNAWCAMTESQVFSDGFLRLAPPPDVCLV